MDNRHHRYFSSAMYLLIERRNIMKISFEKKDNIYVYVYHMIYLLSKNCNLNLFDKGNNFGIFVENVFKHACRIIIYFKTH